MSLQPQAIPPIPELTAQVARAAFPRGNRYLRLRDELGSVFTDADFAALFPRRGQPAAAPWRLALICLFQYAEGLSDREAADAVRGRLDWKYALSLPLTDAGLDASVLAEFRGRLVAGDAAHLLLDRLLVRLQQVGILRAPGGQRTDSTHVLAKVRALNRLTLVGETLRQTLNVLSVVVPAWLRPHLEPAWAERYGARWDDYRLPTGEAARRDLAEQVGRDGLTLLAAVFAPTTPAWLRQVPAVSTLRQVWVQQFWLDRGVLRQRAAADLPPAHLRIGSPYDPQARVAVKRQTVWLGYKVHLSEQCDPDPPHLITAVRTTVATAADADQTAAVEADLAARALLPQTHYVDQGYVTAAQVVASAQRAGVTLLGPVPADTRWQARAGAGFASADFAVDWAGKHAICPAGQRSTTWSPTHTARGAPVISVRFAAAGCAPCPQRAACTRSPTQGRKLTLRPQAEHAVLQAARAQQATATFREQYARRAGVEGTLGQAVAVCELRHARYVGLAKVTLQHQFTAAALNLRRLGEWWEGRPLATTRRSPWLRLLATAA